MTCLKEEVIMARILVTMKDDFLKTIDKVANIEQRSRSELIREALRSYVRKSRTVINEDAKRNASILEKLLD